MAGRPLATVPESAAGATLVCSAPAEAPLPLAGRAPATRVLSRLRGGASWVVATRLAGIAITVVMNMAFARLLTPADFGNFLLLSSVLAFVSLAAMLGLNMAVVRFVAESLGQRDFGRAWGVIKRTAGLAAVSIVAVAALAAVVLSLGGTGFFDLPARPVVIALIVTALVLLSLLQMTAETCRGLHELRLASLFSGGQSGGLVSNLLFLAFAAGALLLVEPTLMSTLAAQVLAMAVALPLALWGLRSALRAHIPGTEAPRVPVLSSGTLLACALPLLFIQLLTFTTSQADFWIAGASCSHDQLALYGAARRLMLLVSMPVQMLNLTVLSSIASLHSQGKTAELQQLLRGAASVAAWLSIGAIVLVVFAGGPTLGAFFGPYFRQAALPLAILGVGQLFLVLAGSCGCALEMTGHQLSSLSVNVVAAVALVAIGSWAAVRFGIVGLACASAGVLAAQSACLWLLARRLVGVWTHPTLFPR